MNRTEKTNQPTAVYTAMLLEYSRAAETVLRREKELKQELRHIRAVRGSGRKRQELIRRILLLGEELSEMRETMRNIRGYAEREVQS
ncbi:MAG: hypothetical protein J6Z45_01720 [Oscillospiraceae bacterium]|nr:hypothetical protein [Oscillospiraceae bacterium]